MNKRHFKYVFADQISRNFPTKKGLDTCPSMRGKCLSGLRGKKNKVTIADLNSVLILCDDRRA